ncbi:Membrane protein involved in the export of O-antigen and teichoic acid [Zobellia uliginosa]|uniref:Membrane protein involved in the export of O-antigen and teichoic acid n=1 Tax=Zobellia uliginosa TaxID=143224 RepID=A0ABY1KNA7_9FLAO|nr:hypothetical protein [Zobellia uliginosa]SIS42725.1 Membrane protein involved in the export of O-antigen and teichoic acid [Zobellia uliginosa]
MTDFFHLTNSRIKSLLPKPLVKAIGQVFSAQILFQIMGLVISLVLVRNLPKSEYALYTVLMAVSGMLSIISNSGIMIGFKKIGSQIWDDSIAFSELIKTTLSLRKYLIIFSFLIAGSYAGLILHRQEVPIGENIFFLCSLLFMAIPSANIGIIRDALLLQKKIAAVQWTSIINQSIRLIAVITVLLLFKEYLTIKTVLVITVIALTSSYFYIKKVQIESLGKPSPIINLEQKATLVKYIKLNWHNSLFFAFRDQIAILILGFFGSTGGLADLGAITRFGLVFLSINALATNILGPSFGRCSEKNKLIKMISITFFGYTILFFVTLLIVYLFSDELLWLLGPKYSNLNFELLLVFTLSLLMLAVEIVNTLNNSKGWIKFSPYFEIPLNILAITCGILFLDLTTVSGGLYLTIFSFASILILYLFNLWYGLKSFNVDGRINE